MSPIWVTLLTGFAREVIPPIWQAITSGNADRAAILARLAAQRHAEHLAAKEMLDRSAKARK